MKQLITMKNRIASSPKKMKCTRVLFAALLLVPLTALRAADGFPEFGWEYVPVYAHVGKTSEDFTAEQLDFLAKHFDFVTIEKHHTWGYREMHGTFDWYPEFDKPLGPPLSEARRTDWLYQREFTHASVSVNLETKTAQIDWK